MTYIFLKKHILMITATSTVKSVSQGTTSARPKWVWHPQCATVVCLVPPVRDSSLSDQSQFWSGSADQRPFLSGLSNQSWLWTCTSSWDMKNIRETKEDNKCEARSYFDVFVSSLLIYTSLEVL